jgi:membrane-associated phospholipid phosphatase
MAGTHMAQVPIFSMCRPFHAGSDLRACTYPKFRIEMRGTKGRHRKKLVPAPENVRMRELPGLSATRSPRRGNQARLKLHLRRIWIGAFASFCWLALAINALVEGRTSSGPSQLNDVVRSWRFEPLTDAMVALDMMVAPLAVISLVAFLAFHAARRQWRALMTFVVFAGGGALLSQALKALVGRSRPPGEALVDVSGYSFPSAQVLAITLVAGWAIHVAGTCSANRSARLLVWLLAAAAVLLVGFSRIYLGAHYPGDVAASILIGISWLCACTVAHGRFEDTRH